MSSLPPPDPAEGNAASVAANLARHEAFLALANPDETYDLAEFFARVEAEEPKHVLGHAHIIRVLEALPHIGYHRSREILNELGIEHLEHVDVLGPNQKNAILNAVAEYDPA